MKHNQKISKNCCAGGSQASCREAAVVLKLKHDGVLKFFRSCGYGLFVSKDGVVVDKSGSEKHQQRHKSAYRVNVTVDKKIYFPTVASLVARAWCPDWFEGCGVIRKDGDMYNHKLENLQVCSMQEFRRFKSRLALIKKAKDRGGDFRSCDLDDIECTVDGVFRRQGVYYKPHYKVVNGLPATTTVCITVEGVRKYYLCADLICRAWRKNKYEEGCYILYKDGNKQNIHLDNLDIVRYDQYVGWLNRKHSKSQTPTVNDERNRMDYIIRCCEMSKRFFDTEDFTEWNTFVERELYPYIVLSCGQKDLGVARTRYAVSELIAYFYSVLERKRGIFNPEALVEKYIRLFSNTGELRLPILPNKAIEKAKELDLSGLAEKYKFYRKNTRYGRPV